LVDSKAAVGLKAAIVSKAAAVRFGVAVSKFSRLERWIERANWRPKLCLGVLAILMAVQVSPWLYPAVDGCLYLKTIREFLSTRNLASFHCYVPPGYLPLIAPAFAFGDRPFLAISILQWLMSLALIGGLYVWARREFPATAVLFTAVVMVNISVWTYYRRPLKEIASMAILMWTVNLMHVLLDERRRARVISLTCAAALLTTYLTLIRYAAITVAIGFAWAACWRAYRDKLGWGRAIFMSSVVGITAASALAGWLYYDKAYGGGGIYWREVASVYSEQTNPPETVIENALPPQGPNAAANVANKNFNSVPANVAASVDSAPQTGVSIAAAAPKEDVGESWLASPLVAPVARFLHGLIYRINDVGCMLVPALWKANIPPDRLLTLPLVLFVLLFAVVALGWLRILRRKIDVLVLTFPAYLVLYSHWVCDQPGGRFMLPMLPIITACLWYGISPFVKRPTIVFGLLIVAHLAQSTAYWLCIDAPRAYQANQNWAMVDRLADVIRRKPGEVAITDAAEPVCQGLWLELDWEFRLHGLKQAPGPYVMWIVEPVGERPLSGFSIQRVDGPVQLLYRNSLGIAGSPPVRSNIDSPALAGNL
jgi:hypothetical protein